mmetsp:Transcript_20058/g.47167  ORF Transcript_20058/g.47167 Transcript_20058/m.47167 type:complete len:809 (-) Transcript_20058:92-2518(-)
MHEWTRELHMEPTSPTSPASAWKHKTERYGEVFRQEVRQVMSRVTDGAETALTASSSLIRAKKQWRVVHTFRSGLAEPLNELDCYRKAAMTLNEAIRLRGFQQPPSNPAAWYAYKHKTRLEKWAAPAIWTLLFLGVVETPLWCNSKLGSTGGSCPAGESPEFLLSGLLYLPVAWAVGVELSILTFLLVHFVVHLRLFSAMKGYGHATTAGKLLVEGTLIALSYVDLASFVAGSTMRVAPVLRFGLAACAVPRLQELLLSFIRTTKAVSKVGMFLVYTVLLFAFVTASTFDDVEDNDPFGTPANTGFTSFSSAVYTCFAALTTATLPDALVPTYSTERIYALIWIPFIFVGSVLLKQVILAGVYTDYSQNAKINLMEGRKRRQSGIESAFALLKTAKEEKGAAVRFNDFEKLVDAMSVLLDMSGTKEMLRVIFQALDDNLDGVLDWSEFQEMCDVLQFQFDITKRDAPLKECLTGTSLGRWMKKLMENGSTGLNLGYASRYPGSTMDVVMNTVVTANVFWVVFESIIDMNNIKEPAWVVNVDLSFSLVYMLEALLKLSYWSWEEYWFHSDNRFDLVTSIILSGVAVVFLTVRHISVETLRSANVLRLLRVLKALKHVKTYRRTSMIVSKLFSTCREVLLLNALVVLLWASIGVEVFGGRLVPSNPRLSEDLGYFQNHYQVLNFNDVPMGMMTLFMWTLGEWNDDLATACLELAEPLSIEKVVIWSFLLSFYIASPLLAYNVLSAFAIDVYQNIESSVSKEEEHGRAECEVERNLLRIQAELAEDGWVLHIQESADLAKLRVHSSLFNVD